MVGEVQRLRRLTATEAVWFDSVNGIAGTDYPVGTPEVPARQETDVLTICAARNIKTIVVHGAFAIPSAMDGYCFIGPSGLGNSTVILNSQSTALSTFKWLEIIGDQNALSTNYYYKCQYPNNINNLAGHFDRCFFGSGRYHFRPVSPPIQLIECIFEQYCTLDFDNGTDDNYVFMNKCKASGEVYIRNFSYGYLQVDMDGGALAIKNDCTQGDAYAGIWLYGTHELINWSGGITVHDHRDRFVTEEAWPRISFLETWQEGIDAAVWTATDPVAGAAWARAAMNDGFVVSAAPNADNTARLCSVLQFPCGGGMWGKGTMWRHLRIQWEMELDGVENCDNSLCFFGLMSGADGNRASNNILGFCLSGDQYKPVGDKNGVEYSGATVTDITPGDRNVFEILLWEGEMHFYINGKNYGSYYLGTKHPAVPLYLNFFLDTEASGAATLYIGPIRIKVTDEGSPIP